MDIVTLKITIINNVLSLKINDIEQQQKEKTIHRYVQLYIDEIFNTERLSRLWTKMCKSPCYIYFLYNVSNLDLRLNMHNIFNSNINNKTLLSNLYFNKNDTILVIDMLNINLDTEINILIKIIIPSKPMYPYIRTNNVWYTQPTSNYIFIINTYITAMIKLKKPNPMFKLCRIDTIEDYDKKIKSFKMPLYDKKQRTNYDVIFDLYPTQSLCYILILSEIINFHNTSSYKINFDKDCTKCVNRIKGCELNMISKVQLCCPCNIELIHKNIRKFIGQFYINFSIKITDFPSYIKDNFHSFPIITL